MRRRSAGAVAAALCFIAGPLAAPPVHAWDWDGAAWADYRPYLGPIDAATKAHLQSIAADGAAAGRVLGRMGQIGDSITESSVYFRNAVMNDVTSNETGHDYAPIRSWLSYSGTQPADANSFYREHGKGSPYGNHSGWKLSDAVADGHPHDAVEVGDGVTPGDFSWAIVMFGTNDIDAGNWNAAAWKEQVRAFVQAIAALGVIPVVSTIPPELAHVADGRVQAANTAILALAAEEDIPWVDYHALILHFQPVAWLGTLISADGTHPTSATGGRGFSQAAQSSTDGYALRTKLAFDAAEKLRAIVFEDGPPDGATAIAGRSWDGAGPDADATRSAIEAWPNPFRGATTLRFDVDARAATTLRIFDAAGRRVREWSVGVGGEGASVGGATRVWDGRDDAGRLGAAGVYFVAREAGGRSAVARLVLLR